MREEDIVVLHSRDEIPELCPECGDNYIRTWTNDARPLGGPYRRFEHSEEPTEHCMVLINNEGG